MQDINPQVNHSENKENIATNQPLRLQATQLRHSSATLDISEYILDNAPNFDHFKSSLN